MTASTLAPVRRSRSRPPAALWVLLVPFLVMFALFFVAPIVFAVVDSLFAQKSSGLGLTAPTREFVFLDNYVAALSSPAFLASLGRLVAFSAIEVPLMVVTALALALLLGATAARFPRLFRVTYFMPYGVPGVIAVVRGRSTNGSTNSWRVPMIVNSVMSTIDGRMSGNLMCQITRHSPAPSRRAAS